MDSTGHTLKVQIHPDIEEWFPRNRKTAKFRLDRHVCPRSTCDAAGQQSKIPLRSWINIALMGDHSNLRLETWMSTRLILRCEGEELRGEKYGDLMDMGFLNGALLNL